MTQPVRTAPTLAEVAAAAGVSRSTASRALNDSPRISEETKRVARRPKVNFVPNARGRALAVGRTEIIAVLVTEPLSELFSDPTYSEFLSGITEELSESSYLPVILQASSTHERNRAREHFERRSFDAVIDVSPTRAASCSRYCASWAYPPCCAASSRATPIAMCSRRSTLTTKRADALQRSL
ncbi:MAG: LacI family DNA-binding transcriptional regulator [Collinsella sp.]